MTAKPKKRTPSKKDLICDIVKAYRHDAEAEGEMITKRRLWYILKPQFARLPSYSAQKIDKKKNPMFDEYGKPIMGTYLTGHFHKGVPVLAVNNADFNKHFNELAEADEVDDTFIKDNSRTTAIGTRLPRIIIASEKATIEDTALELAEKFGCSCYIAGGFSSIYAARNMTEEIEYVMGGYDPNRRIVVIVMSDYDPSGFHIQDTIKKHFKNCDVHRALITPEQIPADRIDEYFAESDELGRHYELDVLNIHELADAFINSIPSHLADEIKKFYKSEQEQIIQGIVVLGAVVNTPEVRALREQIRELETKLTEEYECTFLETDPIRFDYFDTHDIYRDTVNYTVADWLPEGA